MKLIFWGLVIVGLCYVAYCGMISVSAWIAVNNAVDEIVSKEGAENLPPREIKDRVMTAANEAGVPLGEREVIVTQEGRSVRIEVIWTVPVVIVNGDSVVAVPLSVRRTASPKKSF